MILEALTAAAINQIKGGSETAIKEIEFKETDSEAEESKDNTFVIVAAVLMLAILGGSFYLITKSK